jgi:hypothetical protein
MNDLKRSVNEIIGELIRQGWRIRQGRSMHHTAFPPDPSKPVVVISSSPSDFRALYRIRSDLRRSGANI